LEIVVANSAGFCFGVKRAIRMAFDAARKHPPPLFSLGPLIHNPQVVRQLEEVGVTTIDDLRVVERGTVILRSHGVTKDDLALLKTRGLPVVDATCPFVKKAQRYARSLSTQGYTVVIVGDRGHPEVQGILSYIEGEGIAAGSPNEVRVRPSVRKIGVVAQTTQVYENFQDVVARALTLAREVRAYNTICDATHIRQQESVELARRVDSMIVIGGYNSANTSRLTNLCRAAQPNTHHVEMEQEIDAAWFEGVGTVGITAGASTPNWLIDRVREEILRQVS